MSASTKVGSGRRLPACRNKKLPAASDEFFLPAIAEIILAAMARTQRQNSLHEPVVRPPSQSHQAFRDLIRPPCLVDIQRRAASLHAQLPGLLDAPESRRCLVRIIPRTRLRNQAANNGASIPAPLTHHIERRLFVTFRNSVLDTDRPRARA